MNTDSYYKVKAEIAELCSRKGIDPASITVVAATKTRAAQTVDEMYRDLGLRIAGENRAQELRDKAPLVTAPIEWHFIGRLQQNKIKYVVGRVALIHSVDSLALAAAVDKQSAACNKITEILIEVNIGGEDAKGGVKPSEVLPLAVEIAGLKNVRLAGLMTVLPDSEDKEKIKPLALQMKGLYDILTEQALENTDIRYLSMGMSDDYLTAIEAGANMIRLGRCLFGDRAYPAQK